MTGNIDNLIGLYNETRPWERKEGYQYYDLQRGRLSKRAEANNLELERVIAAFAVLSPNNAESTNYRALDTCIEICKGRLPYDARVIAYPLNKVKALNILFGEPIMDNLKGQKVTSFYWNTLDPDNNEIVTVDGHMYGAWINRRLVLRREAEIKSKDYKLACRDFQEAAARFQISTPRFQATLWLAWKRKHKILYQPQLNLEFMNML